MQDLFIQEISTNLESLDTPFFLVKKQKKFVAQSGSCGIPRLSVWNLGPNSFKTLAAFRVMLGLQSCAKVPRFNPPSP